MVVSFVKEWNHVSTPQSLVVQVLKEMLSNCNRGSCQSIYIPSIYILVTALQISYSMWMWQCNTTALQLCCIKVTRAEERENRNIPCHPKIMVMEGVAHFRAVREQAGRKAQPYLPAAAHMEHRGKWTRPGSCVSPCSKVVQTLKKL